MNILAKLRKNPTKSIYPINSFEEREYTQKRSPSFRLLKFCNHFTPHQSTRQQGHAADQ